MSDNNVGRAKLLDYNATLAARIDLTSKLSIFRVKPDAGPGYAGGKVPAFHPGQYSVLGLNNEIAPHLGKTVRAYSIASPPQQSDFLEFYIRYVDEPASDNPLTHMLWRLKEGDRLHLGPKIRGKFNLEETVGGDDPRMKILVGAGTGLAPFYSMAAHRPGGKPTQQRLVVLHGASYPSDLGYREELQKLAAENRNISYFATISRPKQAPEWTGDVGRVESYFQAERLANLEQELGLPTGGINPTTAVIFICGLVGTIHNVLAEGLKLGFVPENRRIKKALGLADEAPSLFYEQYDNTPVIDVRDQAALDQLLLGTPFEGRAQAETAGAPVPAEAE